MGGGGVNGVCECVQHFLLLLTAVNGGSDSL